MRKRIALVGSTGSIGRQVISVVARHPNLFQIVAMSANSNVRLFEKQLAQIQPALANLRSEEGAAALRKIPSKTRFIGGEQGFDEVCGYEGADVVLVAVTGFAGLKATLTAIAAKKTLALANKESLVVGGELVIPAAAKAGVEILPVDSEHSAIWQCLQFRRNAPFSKLILTASGGALRDVPLAELGGVTPARALAHPNWAMGPKITIDCATMLNKGFEVIEAQRLYGADLSRIEVVLHRESIVHSMVTFADGATLAQMSYPSMELPIQTALTYPERLDCALPPVDFCKLGALHFEAVDPVRYPCFAAALECARAGGTAPCVLNAAGEVAVAAFLNGQIKYDRIAQILEGTLSRIPREPVQSYGQLEGVDALARETSQKLLNA